MGAVVAMSLTFVATSEGGAANAQAVVPGQGSAFADTVKVDPRAGNLSIGIDFGKASANHQNTAAQAISQAIDLGTIGTSLASYGCDGSKPSLPPDQQPQPLIADTRTPDSPQEASEKESFAPGFTKSVKVTNAPYAEAVTQTAPFGVQGIISSTGGTSTATSGLVNGVRTATASSDVGQIVLAGAVTLTNLHWDSIWSSDGQQTGHFTAGSIMVAGTPLPVQDPASTLANLNTVLDKVGLHITPPTMHIDQGVVFVDPMIISVVPNQMRDQLLSTLISGVQPIREPLFEALLKNYCKSNTEITIFDIALGSISGAGSFNLLFGGVQSTSGEITANQFNLRFGGLGFGPELSGSGPSLPTLSTNTGAGGKTTGVQGISSSPTTNPPAGNEKAAPAPAAASKAKGKRGGALAGVGLGSLLLLAALAETDRRKMLRAQREIPVLA